MKAFISTAALAAVFISGAANAAVVTYTLHSTMTKSADYVRGYYFTGEAQDEVQYFALLAKELSGTRDFQFSLSLDDSLVDLTDNTISFWAYNFSRNQAPYPDYVMNTPLRRDEVVDLQLTFDSEGKMTRWFVRNQLGQWGPDADDIGWMQNYSVQAGYFSESLPPFSPDQPIDWSLYSDDPVYKNAFGNIYYEYKGPGGTWVVTRDPPLPAPVPVPGALPLMATAAAAFAGLGALRRRASRN